MEKLQILADLMVIIMGVCCIKYGKQTFKEIIEMFKED